MVPARANLLAVAAMFLGVLAAYLPPPGGSEPATLRASDYHLLHQRRISFATQSLLPDSPTLPAWYSRELLGTPFRANLQNFPMIPTRFPLLLVPPDYAMATGATLAALLASLFTFLYARRVGVGPLGAAVAGWSFATAGYFASRVMAGHLPLLEAYPALPLLVWLVERYLGGDAVAVTADRGGTPPREPRSATVAAMVHRGEPQPPRAPRSAIAATALSLATAAILLAGHPQVPAYALGVTALYILFRARGTGRWKLLGALVLGAALAAFALVPMSLLVRRSTRVLALGQAYNDVALPPWRLGSLLHPWANGWPAALAENKGHEFVGNDVVFWDTVIYMGLLPLLAAAFLGTKRLFQRRRPESLWLFWLTVGVLATVAALPFAHRLLSLLPGTYLRSPARQFYVTTFTLALAAGSAMEAWWRGLVRTAPQTPHGLEERATPDAGPSVERQEHADREEHVGRQECLSVDRQKCLSYWWQRALVIALIAGNALDVTLHDRAYIQNTPAARMDSAQRDILAAAGSARVAFDFSIPVNINRELDDVGFFDSLMLARSYRTLLSLAQLPATTNIQEFSGSRLSPGALAFLGVKYVLTPETRLDLQRVGGWPGIPLYEVRNPAPRAAFYPASSAVCMSAEDIQARLRHADTIPLGQILLPTRTAPDTTQTATNGSAPLPCPWRREGPDTIAVDLTAPSAGYVMVLETADDGWSATVDGISTPVIIADDTFLAVAVAAGKHAVQFHYSTPGAWLGLGISVTALAMLLGMALPRRRRQEVIPER
ncbi:MAG: YfhO family protein [Tepidisphaerales bacterium]